MTGERVWSFRTLRGSVHVAPTELRIHHRVTDTLAGGLTAIAAGRFPPIAWNAGWSALALAFALASVGAELAWSDGATLQLILAALGAVAVFGGGTLSMLRRRAKTIPLADIVHVSFDDGELVVVSENGGGATSAERGSDAGTHRLGSWNFGWGGSDERTETTLYPLDDRERADAALALRLRGVDLRGVTDDPVVSRTVIDARKTELVN